MKVFSNQQKFFGMTTVLLSLIFFFFLYETISNQRYNNIWIMMILFSSAMFVNGFIFGHRESNVENNYKLGFRYHLISYISINFIGTTMLFLVLGINLDNILTVAFQIIAWGIGLFFHWFFTHFKLTFKSINT
jgi:hypothetical protein